MYSQDHDASPINPMPPAVTVLAIALAVPELIFQAGEYGMVGGASAVGWRINAITSYGFFDTVFNWMLATGRLPGEHLIRFITYAFVNAGLSSAIFAIVLVLAIGKMVAESFSQATFLIICAASTLVGALAYGVVLDSTVPLLGAYPAAYGLIGAFTLVLFIKARAEGGTGLRAFSLIGLLLALQLFFGLVFGSGGIWVADLAGFLTGFGLSFVLAPGGMERARAAMERMRRR